MYRVSTKGVDERLINVHYYQFKPIRVLKDGAREI